ncbi:MAG: Type 1 glutamine amidotransferase-like domain-containing protein [bacterium]|nr:Type 1 glutamine amidotransferase-like domain-containing protein [bacterium]
MKLFLTSAGLPPETTEAFLNLLDKKPEEARICLIITASLVHHPKGDAPYVKKDEQRLSELGFKTMVEINLRNETEESLNNKFKNFDVIFVEGGNTFYLLKYMRESGFSKALRSFLDKGGIYFGVSAGSIAAGKDISCSSWEPDWDENTVGLRDFRGLGLVNFVIVPHYEPAHEKIVLENKDKVLYPVIALADKQAILVDNKKIQFIGPGEFKRFE